MLPTRRSPPRFFAFSRLTPLPLSSSTSQVAVSHFEAYIDKFYPEARRGKSAAVIERISEGLRKKDITLASLIQVAESIVLSTGVKAGAAIEPDQEQRGENGCLMYNGEECNGERAGTCKAQTCHCVGQWTGIRCQSDWSIKRFNPYTGLSEANEECAGDAADYMKGC